MSFENPEDIFKNIQIPNSNRLATRELVLATLQEAIVRSYLKPGTWLSEEQLSSMLKVSRTPIREALFQLQSNELVERGENGRLYVRELSVKEALDLYAVRESLDELVVIKAAENMTHVDLSSLYVEIERMKIAAQGPDFGDVGDGGRMFHELLYSIADNQVAKYVLSTLQPRFDRYRYLSTGTGKQRSTLAIKEHEEIYLALSEKDVLTARKLMKEHLENSKRTVIKMLTKLMEGEVS